MPELSRRGRFLILIPIYLLAGGFLLQNPYVVITGFSVLGLFIYSRHYLKRNIAKLDISNEVDTTPAAMDKIFTSKTKIYAPRPMYLEFKPSHGEYIEAKDDSWIEETVHKRCTFERKFLPKRRGYHKVGGARGWVYDPLQLYRTELTIEPEEDLIVQSSKEAIKRAQTFAKRSRMEEMVEDIFRFTTTSGELEEIREYQPGDRLRDIHWKSVSKFQRHMTKVYEKMALLECHILLDCSPSMRRADPEIPNKMEHAIFLAAELLKKFELAGHDIGLTSFDHKKVLFHHAPDHRRATFKRLFKSLSDLPGPTPIKGYQTNRYSKQITMKELKRAEEEFSKKVGMLISSRSSGATGIINAVRAIQSRSQKRALIILISDMESQTNLKVKAIEKLKEMNHEVWLIVPFSPWYEFKDVNQDILEKSYEDYERLENILTTIHRAGVSVFELHPKKEGLKILEERGVKTF